MTVRELQISEVSRMTDNRNKAISRILLFVFSFVIFSSSLFIILHTDHECTGENCPECMELANCCRTLHTLGTALTKSVRLTVMVFVPAAATRSVIRVLSRHTTLISLKVELLN